MKFSIIVPIHNVEKYLMECLESIATQIIKDYEVILVVNDSRDNSLQICEKWAENRTDTKILVTEIPGVSHARNMGIRVAEGNWLVFLDSDDRMRINALSCLEQGIEEGCNFIVANYSSQTVVCNYSKRKCIITATDYQKTLLDRAQYFQRINSGLTWNPIVLDSVWAKAYNANIIKSKNIEFRNDISIGEDLLFNIQYSSNVDQVYCMDEDVYYYREIIQSASRENSVAVVEKRMKFFAEVENMELSDELKKVKDFKVVDILLRSIVAGSSKKSDITETYQTILPYLQKETIRTKIRECRSSNLSNGKVRNIFYCEILGQLKKERYKAALWIGYIYNQIIKIRK